MDWDNSGIVGVVGVALVDRTPAERNLDRSHADAPSDIALTPCLLRRRGAVVAVVGTRAIVALVPFRRFRVTHLFLEHLEQRPDGLALLLLRHRSPGVALAVATIGTRCLVSGRCLASPVSSGTLGRVGEVAALAFAAVTLDEPFAHLRDLRALAGGLSAAVGDGPPVLAVGTRAPCRACSVVVAAVVADHLVHGRPLWSVAFVLVLLRCSLAVLVEHLVLGVSVGPVHGGVHVLLDLHHQVECRLVRGRHVFEDDAAARCLAGGIVVAIGVEGLALLALEVVELVASDRELDEEVLVVGTVRDRSRAGVLRVAALERVLE